MIWKKKKIQVSPRNWDGLMILYYIPSDSRCINKVWIYLEREERNLTPWAKSDMFIFPSLVDKDWKFWSSLMSEQDGFPQNWVIRFTSWKLIFSKANSAVPRQIQVLLLLKSAQKFSCPCLWQRQKWGFHKCAIQEAEELQCKSLDRHCTKENRPFCPDASKVMRLSYDIPWKENSHTFKVFG